MNPAVLVRSALVAIAGAFAWAGASAATAADVTPPPPPPVYGAPVAVGDPGCETCQHGTAKAKCAKCGSLLSLHRNGKTPYPVNLCPGACFGYFQTQWRKWDEVCPYPYLGVGVSDAPRPPAGVLNPGGPTPRPLDPKMMDPKLPDPKPFDPKLPDPKPLEPKKTGAAPTIPPIPVVQSKFTVPG
ncbi:MAG: hypothetical protein FJ304_05620 [Planctomycetes bacterium]|nr:hypothetical protein [Planctomycetota bacterium]